MSLSRNFLAGFANSAWSAFLGLALIPLYLKYLGIEAYGLIGFFATMQSVFWILDFGMVPTINREVARFSASGRLSEAGELLHTLAVIYWGMGIAIALLIGGMAPIIARHWLQSSQIPLPSIDRALVLMGLVVACRWPIGLYQGALNGAQRITLSSAISIAMISLGNLGAVVILAFISPTIEAFFIWQAAVGLVYALIMRWAAWRVIACTEIVKFETSELKRIWRFSAGATGLAISASILMQVDKVLLSKVLSLADFGKYALAGVITSGLYVLLAPVFNAIYPRFSALVVAKDTPTLINLYRMGTRCLASVLFPAATIAGVFSEDLVYLWTGNKDIALGVAPILALLLMGTAINGVMIFPYALQLAYGALRLPLLICLVLIVGTVPTTIFLATEYGAIGGASAWVLMNSIYLLMGSWLTHRQLLKDIGFKWLLWDAGFPLICSILIIRFMGEKICDLRLPPMPNIFMAFGLVTLGIFALILTSPPLTRILLRQLRNALLR